MNAILTIAGLCVACSALATVIFCVAVARKKARYEQERSAGWSYPPAAWDDDKENW